MKDSLLNSISTFIPELKKMVFRNYFYQLEHNVKEIYKNKY